MNNKTKISYDNPKLLNYYGDSFDYKNNFGEGSISMKLHCKKLNAEREIKKTRIQKKLDKINLVSIKENFKIKNAFKKSSIKMEFKNEILKIKTLEKSLNTKLDLSDFISLTIRDIKKTLRDNFLSAKKTINSIKTTGDDPKIIQEKISQLYLYAQNKEIKYQKLLLFFEYYKKNIKKTDHANYNSLKEYIFPDNILYFNEINEEKLNKSLINFINKKIDDSFLAYDSQWFFKIPEEEKLEYKFKNNEKINLLKTKYKVDKRENKIEKKSSLKKEKLTIFEKARDNIKFNKKNYQEAKKYSKKVNDDFKKLDDAEKLMHIKNIKNIKNIKQTNRQKIKFDIKNFKENNSRERWKKLGLKLFIANPILFMELINNDYKTKLNELKANNKILLGSQLQDLTFEGDYIGEVGRAKLNFIKYNREIKQEFINDYNKNYEKFNSIPSSTVETEKSNKKEKILSRIIEFKKLKKDIIIKFNDKEISNEAKKAAILKEKIYLGEDIRILKMGSEIAKAKFSIKDSLVAYSKKNSLNKNN
ncbi:MAG: hypothetical protein KFW07_02355, partial [Mycoplasmataceae bacterium]|nr:hypothetical protein [Mycoplasmataceae bacterium]